MSPRRHRLSESAGRRDPASLGLTLLLGAVVCAGVGAVALYQELNLIRFEDPREPQRFTLRIAMIRNDAAPFLSLSILLGWTGVIVSGIAACQLWGRRSAEGASPVTTFAGLVMVGAALLPAFYPVWRFLAFAPLCIDSMSCTDAEYRAIFTASDELLISAKLAVIAFEVLLAVGLLVGWIGVERMRRARATPDGGVPRQPPGRRLHA